MTLKRFFVDNPDVALGFSGGVDSSYLLYAARENGARVTPFFVNSPFQPAFELEDARALAAHLGVQMIEIELDPLALPDVAKNGADRCYYCKHAIFGAIVKAARERGIGMVIDGNNASDDASDRQGMRAVEELAVRSPLRECGITKAQVRELSREAGLFTWDKPAYACLATRVPTGTAITREALAKVERAESALSGLGFRDFRVRMAGGGARLEVTAAQMPRVIELRDELLHALSTFDMVTLNLLPRK